MLSKYFINGYIAVAQQAVREQIQFPHGYYATWSGQSEYMQGAAEKLKVVVQLTIFLVFVLVYLNFGRDSPPHIIELLKTWSLILLGRDRVLEGVGITYSSFGPLGFYVSRHSMFSFIY